MPRFTRRAQNQKIQRIWNMQNGWPMAGDALATIRCDKCENPAAQIKKTKNSPLLYVHCSCGLTRSSGKIFQEKLQNAIKGISENVQTETSEIVQEISEDWKPDITTQSAPLKGISEINQSTPEQAPTVPKDKTAKKVAGFGLFALALLGLAFKVAK